MSRKRRQPDEFSAWNEAGVEGPAHLVPAEAKRAEVNGAPTTDKSHEYVVKKTDAPD